jgi:FlaA1/EpsC-like NDP-sugar epimerase
MDEGSALALETPSWAIAAIGRSEHDIPVPPRLGRILVTGASGSIGSAVVHEIERRADHAIFTDLDECDVRNADAVRSVVDAADPDVILHLAGAKHAPEGELDPDAAMVTNTLGTRNVLLAARGRSRVVMASTCKACDPETVYGASKLIAERMALNEGGTVVRYYNVVETSGNVFELWAALPGTAALPVAPSCERIFMSAREAAGLTLWSLAAPPGRYVVHSVVRRGMESVAADVYPGRALKWIHPRRGDRLVEPLTARCESLIPEEGVPIARVVSPHDPLA